MVLVSNLCDIGASQIDSIDLLCRTVETFCINYCTVLLVIDCGREVFGM